MAAVADVHLADSGTRMDPPAQKDDEQQQQQQEHLDLMDAELEAAADVVVEVVCRGVRGTLNATARQVTCWCPECKGSTLMSPSKFEAHCGAAAHKNWRNSFKHAEDGCSIGQWLNLQGIAPAPRLRSGSSKDHKAAKVADLAPLPPRTKVKTPRYGDAGRSDGQGGAEGNGGPLTGSGDQGEHPVLAQHPPHDVVDVEVVCKDISGLLNLSNWRVSCHCAECEPVGRRMSPPAFEVHAGAGSNKKWRHSLRVPSEGGCSINRWLLARGIIPPGTRNPAQGSDATPRGDGVSKKARLHRGSGSGAGGGYGGGGWGLPRAAPAVRGPGRPSKARPSWRVQDVMQLLGALQGSEASQRHAKTLTGMLAAAAVAVAPGAGRDAAAAGLLSGDRVMVAATAAPAPSLQPSTRPMVADGLERDDLSPHLGVTPRGRDNEDAEIRALVDDMTAVVEDSAVSGQSPAVNAVAPGAATATTTAATTLAGTAAEAAAVVAHSEGSQFVVDTEQRLQREQARRAEMGQGQQHEQRRGPQQLPEQLQHPPQLQGQEGQQLEMGRRGSVGHGQLPPIAAQRGLPGHVQTWAMDTAALQPSQQPNTSERAAGAVTMEVERQLQSQANGQAVAPGACGVGASVAVGSAALQGISVMSPLLATLLSSASSGTRPVQGLGPALPTAGLGDTPLAVALQHLAVQQQSATTALQHLAVQQQSATTAWLIGAFAKMQATAQLRGQAFPVGPWVGAANQNAAALQQLAAASRHALGVQTLPSSTGLYSAGMRLPLTVHPTSLACWPGTGLDNPPSADAPYMQGASPMGRGRSASGNLHPQQTCYLLQSCCFWR